MEIRQNYKNSAKMYWITVFIVIIGAVFPQNVLHIYAKLSTDNSPEFAEALSNNLPPYHDNPFNRHRNGNEVNGVDVWLTSGVNPYDEPFNKFNGNRDDEQLSEGERAAHENKNGVTEMMAKEKGYLQSGNTSKSKQQLLTVLQQNKCNGNTKTTTTTTATTNNKKQANTLSDKATTTPRTLTTMVTKKNAGMLTALSMRVNKNDFDKVDGRVNATSRNHTEAVAAIKVKTATTIATATVKTKQPTPTTTTATSTTNFKRNSITSNNNSGITATGVGSSVNTRLYYHNNGFLNPFGQLVAFFGSDQLHLQDYTFFFNAERHTVFHLHTSNNYYNGITGKSNSHISTVLPTFAETVAAGSILNVVTDPIGAVFGVNTPTTTTSKTKTKTKTKTSTTSSSAVSTKNTVSNTTGKSSAFTTTTAYTVPASLPPPATIKVEEVQLYNGKSLRQSRFNPFNPTRILVHGWFGGANAGVYQTLVPAYLRQDTGNYNVFTVDWGRGAVADYLTASYRVKPVGKVLAKFIDFLQREAGIRYEDLHVIGFSMGAHIAGIAGKHVQTGRLPVIYALDPALPFFRYENFDERVAITDADYVEVVHTSVGSYGYDRPLGHVDFYVNYGSAQPGCFLNECSHFRAFQIFAESLQAKDGFQAQGCDVKLWPDLIKHRRCLMGTGRRMRLGGDPVNVTALRGHGGVFYLATNAVPPYAKVVT